MKRLRAAASPLAGVLVAAYFVFHAVNGDHGLVALWRMESLLTEANVTHAALVHERQVLAHRVYLLEDSSLDPDFLEERARLMSGLGRANDIVILTVQ